MGPATPASDRRLRGRLAGCAGGNCGSTPEAQPLGQQRLSKGSALGGAGRSPYGEGCIVHVAHSTRVLATDPVRLESRGGRVYRFLDHEKYKVICLDFILTGG